MERFGRWLGGVLLALALGTALSGCAQLRDEMRAAQRAYERDRYEDALTWLSDLEDDVPEMDRRMRVRFYFLRGMTAYHLDQRDDALHYLALAREEIELARERGSRRVNLPREWAEQLDEKLQELTPTERGAFHARRAGATSGGEQEAAPGS